MLSNYNDGSTIAKKKLEIVLSQNNYLGRVKKSMCKLFPFCKLRFFFLHSSLYIYYVLHISRWPLLLVWAAAGLSLVVSMICLVYLRPFSNIALVDVHFLKKIQTNFTVWYFYIFSCHCYKLIIDRTLNKLKTME